MPRASRSLWDATAGSGPPRRLDEAARAADVAVVGAGVLGTTTALLLARAGARVTLVEADRIGRGVTGYTTGKVTAAHGLRYAQLRRTLGEERTRQYASANQAAVRWIRDLIAEHGIACDWRDRPAWTTTSDPDQRSTLEDEAAATIAAGLPAQAIADESGPTPMLAGVRVDGGGELHGRRYAQGVALLAEQAGARIAEHVRVLGVHDGDPCRLRTTDGELRADQVVIATHVPILDRGLFFARTLPERSYAIAARVERPPPPGMFYDVGTPVRSVRTAPGPDGQALVIVGGESHPSGRRHDGEQRYARLEEWAAERFGDCEVTHRWSSQDLRTPDQVPLVGQLWPGTSRLWAATGFGKWGLSGGTAAAHALVARIGGGIDPHRALWDSSRIRQLGPRSALRLAQWNAEVSAHLVGDRVARRPRPGGTDGLAPGDGAIVRSGGRRTAAFRDDDGRLHLRSPRCTHLGCEVAFNPAERSWDCPCHGSRFDARDGAVLEGPAVRPLAPRDGG